LPQAVLLSQQSPTKNYTLKLIISAIRQQLTFQPTVGTLNRKQLRMHPIATWELQSGKYRCFYEVDEVMREVVIVSVGHKIHDRLFIRDVEVKL